MSDCPHRERLGYGGDGQISIDSCVMNLQMPSFYEKWTTDWRDVQDPQTGFIPHTAPQGEGGGGPAWGAGLQALTWRLNLYYDDRRALAENYSACNGYVEFLESHEKDGVLRAISVVQEVSGAERPNVLGFCIGGTMLASALAVAAGRGDLPVESLTLLTALLDFEEPGDLACFIDEASVATRENTIGKGGLLTGREFSGVFSALRPNDLVWNYVVDNYLKGRSPTAFDLLHWNADSTNLPGPFAAWYLRNMYLENNLRVPGKLTMAGVPVDLGRISCPTYFLSTREDHIVPWRSSYLGRRLVGGETTFVLGASGHIAGVINPAAKNRRSYWTGGNGAASAEEWLAGAKEYKGSWWPHWIQWLHERGGAERAAPKRLGDRRHREIEPAPGRYVKEPA